MAFLQGSSRPLIVILGPTASGKTAFSLDLAHSIKAAIPGRGFGAEIVNADSRQLYKFMDIGTAKISKDEMQGIPHHLINVLDPKEPVTAAWYKTQAAKVIDDIHKRGNVPMLVGGSMLYISAVIDDLQFVDVADPGQRAMLEAAYDKDEGMALYERLQKEDPETAGRFDRRNKPYVIRAAEILESGHKPSAAKRKGTAPYDLLIFGMDIPRDALARCIEERTKTLLQNGWIDEVRQLLKDGYTELDPGFGSVGYREIAAAISNGKLKTCGEQSRTIENSKLKEQLVETISAKTRQYAKRQMTWWRRDERIQWIKL